MTDTLFKIAIALGLAVLLPFLVYYGVATLHPPPVYEDYVTVQPEPRPLPETDPDTGQAEEAEAALETFQAQLDELQKAEEAFGRTLFYVAAPVGFLCILVSGFVGLPGVGPGLVLGGGATVTVAYAHEWERLSNAWRFGALALALAAVLFVAWRLYRASGRA